MAEFIAYSNAWAVGIANQRSSTDLIWSVLNREEKEPRKATTWINTGQPEMDYFPNNRCEWEEVIIE